MSIRKTLLAIGALATVSSFTPSLPSRPARKLNLYVPEEGYGGGGYDQYPGPMDMMGGHFEQPPGQDYEAMVYDYALDCANNPGMCAIDELMGLAHGETSDRAFDVFEGVEEKIVFLVLLWEIIVCVL
jgi:hypothetical protein